MIDEQENNDAWIVDMYADDPYAEEKLAKKQAAMAHARAHIKRRNKDSLEFMDENGTKLIAPSESYIKDLESKINRQQEIIKIQAGQIAFLSNKFSSLEKDISQLQDAMKFIYERF